MPYDVIRPVTTVDTPTSTIANITVIDSIMGSGKTTWMINHVNEIHTQNTAEQFHGLPGDRRVLYVAPLLSEVDRIKEACPDLQFKDPQPIEGRKLHHLKTLIREGENVCTTHALFSMLDREVYALLKARKYTLVIDEVITCVDMLKKLSKTDRKTLFDSGFIYIEEGTDRLRWNHDRCPNYRGRFEDIRNLCDNGNLVVYRPKRKDGKPVRGADAEVLMWEFPADFLRCFGQVFVLTYLFDGSPMRAYLQAEGLSFSMKAVADGALVDWSSVDETAIKTKLRQLVTIYEGPMNDTGIKKGRGQPLSSGWFDRADPRTMKRLKSSTIRFFEKVARTPSAVNAWTSFNKVRRQLAGKGYARGFIPVNAKATNDHIEKRSVAYLCNIFHQPVIRGFFEDRHIPVHEEMFALSEMIQWLWRSRIRRGEPISVFVPSERMRLLLKEWLGAGEINMGFGIRSIIPSAVAQQPDIARTTLK